MRKETSSYDEVSKKRVAWTAFWFFVGTAIPVWLFSEQIAIIFLYVSGHDITDMLLFNRARVSISVSATIILFLLSYCAYIQHLLSRKPAPSLSKEVVSGLMLSHEQFRKLYDNSPVPYFLMDDAGNIRNPNVAALRFFGGTLEECAGSNFYSLLAEEGKAERTISLLRAKVERSVPISQEEMKVYPLNRQKARYVLASIYSLEKTSPIPFKHLVTLVDVSRERENEQMKTDFLLLASHQLRTPLTTIKWYIDYLLSSTEKIQIPAIVKEYLEQIYIGNERMIELITTLLTVSKIEMGVLAPDYKPVKVNDVIKDILDELSTDIQKRGTKVKVSTEGDDVLVMDYTMIRIIIHNLLTNAIKYTPKGGTVTVDSKFGAYTCNISVTDTGCGIPLDEQDKIFTKMFRASNARKVSTSGTGLGLYMSKAFTERLGGTLTFSSGEGKGTTFIITLPHIAPDA